MIVRFIIAMLTGLAIAEVIIFSTPVGHSAIAGTVIGLVCGWGSVKLLEDWWIGN